MESEQARDGGTTVDERSGSKEQLPRMNTRTLIRERKRRKGMSLGLLPDGGQVTPHLLHGIFDLKWQ